MHKSSYRRSTYPGLVNIVTGAVVDDPSVTMDNAYELGLNEMRSFEETWRESFHEPLTSKKHIPIGEKSAYDKEIIYARAMSMQHSDRKDDRTHLMCHELSPYPASMFGNNGQMKQAT